MPVKNAAIKRVSTKAIHRQSKPVAWARLRLQLDENRTWSARHLMGAAAEVLPIGFFGAPRR